jgi:hypothetical protein
MFLNNILLLRQRIGPERQRIGPERQRIGPERQRIGPELLYLQTQEVALNSSYGKNNRSGRRSRL